MVDLSYDDDYDDREDFDGEDDYDLEIEDDDYLDDDDSDDSDSLDNSDIDDNDVAISASIDGAMDATYNGVPYAGYESSVDADKLTDEQKDLYETEYLAGYQDQENQEEDD